MRKKLIIGLGACLLILIVLGSLAFVFRKTLLGLAANGADNVLRPLIGSENTLRIESVLFSLQDKVNQIHDTAPTSADMVFNIDGVDGSKKYLSKMQLTAIKPIATHSLFPNEGVWAPMPVALFPDRIVLAKALLHADKQRPYAYVALVKMDMTTLELGAVAGIKQPGGPIGNPGEGKVPDEIKSNNLLIAAFDGGFQYRDGAYGMVVSGKTYVPLRNGLASLFIDNKGKAQIGEYDGTIPANTVVVRQNGPLLVKDGQITPFTEAGKDTWGRTVTVSMYTWRSAIGQAKDGDLIYAVGPSLRPQTMAAVMQAAGAVNAMQLDINPFWVRFVLFSPSNDGTYTSESLLKNMENGGKSYLNGYQKDFFYLYKK